VRPDVAVLDLAMPGMDGVQLARRLCGQPGLAGLALVALSGTGSEAYRRQALAAGFACCLAKPARMDVLQRLLEALAPQGVALAQPGTTPVAEPTGPGVSALCPDGAPLSP
jgi:CheY-like chemotaxis protein